MSVAHRPTRGTWLLSSKEMDAVKAALMKGLRIDRTYDVPYVAGYNKQNTVVYIDHQMPKGFSYKGRTILTDPYLVMHERIEDSLEAGPPPLPYLFAHQIALRSERDAVVGDGISWTVYNNFMMHWIKVIGSRASYPNCPRDLDLEPYRGDRATLRKMRFSNATGD